jgi:hypothetical protein
MEFSPVRSYRETRPRWYARESIPAIRSWLGRHKLTVRAVVGGESDCLLST